MVYSAEVPPAVIKSNCPFSIPSGEKGTCGYITVPENRSKSASKTIQLFFIIAKSYSNNPEPDPVVFLSGGPGYGRSATLAYKKTWKEFFPFRMNRDVIFIDQRGTGLSKPRLDCDIPDLKYSTNVPSKNKARINEGIKKCRDVLVKKNIDLSAYNTIENAKDIIDVINALNYKKWNMMGVSYGSGLALAIMKERPSGLRSAIIDAVMPLHTDEWDLDRAINNKRIFLQLFTDCKNDKTCHANYPNLKNKYHTLIKIASKDKDNIAPSMIIRQIQNQFAGSNTTRIPYLIEKLYQLAINKQLNTKSFNTLLGINSNGKTNLQLGMNFSVMCNDKGTQFTKQQMLAKIKKSNSYFPYYDSEYSSLCEIWGGNNVLSKYDEKTYPHIPTLILTGEFDTDLPSTWAASVANSVTPSYYFQFRGVGHITSTHSLCAKAMAVRFINKPTESPHLPCYDSQTAPHFFVE